MVGNAHVALSLQAAQVIEATRIDDGLAQEPRTGILQSGLSYAVLAKTCHVPLAAGGGDNRETKHLAVCMNIGLCGSLISGAKHREELLSP